MKIQLNLDNPKAIMLYELLEKKMKSKSFEYALVLLAEDEASDVYFGYENAKKAKEIINGDINIVNVKDTQNNEADEKAADDEDKSIAKTKENGEEAQTEATVKPYKIEL